MPPNRIRRTISWPAPYVPVKKIEMTTIGQNSPATPVPSTALPIGVGISPASERIGTSVPSAVVASAIPISHHEASTPARSSTIPTVRPRASEIAHPPLPRATARLGTFFSITSRPAKKKRNASPRFSRKST